MGEPLEVLNVRREMMRRRGPFAAWIDAVGRVLQHPLFFVALLLAHGLWVVLNTGWIPGVTPFDPPPFVGLATIASVEAPFLSLLILMRQHRDSRIEELRGEVALQVALHIERKAACLVERLSAGEDEDLSRTRDLLQLFEQVKRHLDEDEGERS